jgi:hypothetical protein
LVKWADYYISAVKYNDEHTRIIATLVHEDQGERIGEGIRRSRSDVTSIIKTGKSFSTIRKGTDDKWNKGADIHIVKMGAVEFIRTDKNQKDEDNLGSLPEL